MSCLVCQGAVGEDGAELVRETGRYRIAAPVCGECIARGEPEGYNRRMPARLRVRLMYPSPAPLLPSSPEAQPRHVLQWGVDGLTEWSRLRGKPNLQPTLN